ncbi:hypothetical protein C8R43DRAFT_524286 [Mycena crocata]|nr:hypothetical protein C8R43DRAFT_524286 [Mycena crocata]
MTFASSQLLPDATTAAHIRGLVRTYADPPSHIPSTVSALSDELARYDTEIALLRARLAVVEQERATLKTYHDDCCGLLSPIRRLPPETLVEIFRLWRNGAEPLFRRRNVAGYIRAPQMNPIFYSNLRSIAQVCTRWHSIIMDTSSFWSYVDLDEDLLHNFRDAPEKMMEPLGVVLGRSRETPLDVVLDGRVPTPAVELLADLSERWKTARIGRLPHATARQLWSRICEKLPILERLELRPYYSTFSSFGLPPNLRTLTLPGYVLESLRGPLPATLRTLNCVTLGPADIPNAVALLSAFQNTSGKCAFVINDNHEGEIEMIPLSTSNIHSLLIEAGPNEAAEACVQSLFASLTLPNLRDFLFNSPGEELEEKGFFVYSDFLDLSARSRFHDHLVSLEVHDILLRDGQLLEILTTLPSLECLKISDRLEWLGHVVQHLITDTLLESLSHTPHSPCLVPRLRFLSLRTILKFDDTVFMQFLSSRVGDGRRFECEIHGVQPAIPINVRYTRDLDAAVMEQIHHLCAQGILVFSYKRPGQPELK